MKRIRYNDDSIITTKDKTIYESDKHKTPHSIYDDIDEEYDDDEPIHNRRHSHRERVYLTHITWFGLRNQRYSLNNGVTTIGRYDEVDRSDIMIRGDETMSRQSIAIIAEIVNGIYEYKLKVLNATNKVKINDHSIREGAEVYLDFGDIILLGNSKFKFDNH